ncbi:MAG: hypothetical protein HQL31_01935 [Planctomycetes bacterium]|nr:hypothetical protein [Planctomycetota bacterium]
MRYSKEWRITDKLLLNIEHLARYRGLVDAIIIPSWNQDLKTFSPTVESAAFSTHSYIIYCNNGKYGDVRIRTPRAIDYQQDVCRTRGGINQYIIVSEIELDSLRMFQTRHEMSEDNKEWKPTPDGFKIAAYRESRPAK